jgi:DNA-binding NarL/FixJ family response regulator
VRRFVVLEEATPAAVDAATAELAANGAAVSRDWQTQPVGPTVCVGSVRCAQDAGRAVLAAVAGAWLVVDADAPRDVVDQLCDDLGRIGEVDHRVGPHNEVSLSRDETALLAQLLSGSTLGEAARALHISRRTADRRLAAARSALGARTTVEALRLAAEAGIAPNH